MIFLFVLQMQTLPSRRLCCLGEF